MNGFVNLPPELRAASGYVCKVPFVFEFQGEAFTRPCGHCGRCIASKMRDLTARAAAEATQSDEMVVFTLTYRPGEAGAHEWVVPDRQRFLKRVRKTMWDDARKRVGAPTRLRGEAGRVWKAKIDTEAKRVRYFGCGEIGQRRTKRHHWHVVLFFSCGNPAERSGFVSSRRDLKGKMIGEDHAIWPHGISTIHVLPNGMGDRIAACRYVAKYVGKALLSAEDRKAGEKKQAMLFRSLKPALGAEYLAQWGARHAQQGLPLPEMFRVPNVVYTRGKRRGHQVENRPTGVSRQTIIAAYRDEWQRLRPGRDVPDSAFRAKWDSDYIAPPARKKKPIVWRERGTRPPVPAKPPTHCAGLLRVSGGYVRTLRNGVAVWLPPEGKPVLLGEGLLDDVGAFPAYIRREVRDWVQARRRDPAGIVEWASPKQRFDAWEDRRCARDEARWSAFDWGPLMKMGTASRRPLTHVRRRLVLAGRVDPDGKARRREYRPPRDVQRLLWRDDFADAGRIADEDKGRGDDPPRPAFILPPLDSRIVAFFNRPRPRPPRRTYILRARPETSDAVLLPDRLPALNAFLEWWKTDNPGWTARELSHYAGVWIRWQEGEYDEKPHG